MLYNFSIFPMHTVNNNMVLIIIISLLLLLLLLITMSSSPTLNTYGEAPFFCQTKLYSLDIIFCHACSQLFLYRLDRLHWPKCLLVERFHRVIIIIICHHKPQSRINNNRSTARRIKNRKNRDGAISDPRVNPQFSLHWKTERFF